MPDPLSKTLVRGKVLALLAVGVIVLSLIGYAMGTNPKRYVAKEPPSNIVRDVAEGLEAARSHRELANHAWRSGVENSGWQIESLADLTPREVARQAEKAAGDRSDRKRTRVSLRERQSSRAFDGAPPTIPHPVRQGSASECMACHADGMRLGDLVANPIPHAAFASCTQCHVVQAAPFTITAASPAASASSDFKGARSPLRGERAYATAPPTIPHTTWMREKCDSCHGVGGRAGLTTPHPERQSCTQCHVPSAALDQRRG